MFDWYARALEGYGDAENDGLEHLCQITGEDDVFVKDRVEVRTCRALRGRLSRLARGFALKLAVYGAAGMGVMATTPACAFATSGSLDIRNVSSILDFLGNICIVVGVVLAGWNVVQAAQTAKETQGLQIDRSFWGIIGGIGMAIGGGAIKTAGSLWRYGSAS